MSGKPTPIQTELDRDNGMVGATREGLLQQLVFGSIPETVGREADGTVIMAKRTRCITSRLRRLFSRG